MANVTPTGALDSLGRQSFVAELSDLSSTWELGLPSPRFACLVALDSGSVEAAELLAFARSLIAQGAAYVCAWGPGCRDFEDAVDQAGVESDTELNKENPVVMTTAHPDDSLEEALEFLSRSAFPDEAYADQCRSSIAISIGNPIWSGQMKRWFAQAPS